VFSSYPEGSPGPDGLPYLFYQKYWDILKGGVCRMVQDFFDNNLELLRLNFVVLTLIPKVEEAMDMKNFRPISLLICSFKIFSKLLTLRLERVCQSLIVKEQSAFIRGRYILESVVVAHEIVHTIHKSKEPGVVIKLDYEKAYDKVNIEFLLEILKLRGFGEKWISWIKSLVIGGSVSVMINGEESLTFKTGKGLRQGDHLSPILFNLVVDVLTKMLEKASSRGLVTGLLSSFNPRGILVLQYADDTLLFSSCDLRSIRNLKCILMLFERVSGMKINFLKSEMVTLNLRESDTHAVSHVLSCPMGSFPLKYLGIPLHFEKLKREDLHPIFDKSIKRIAGWMGKLLAYNSRLVLMKTCLTSIPVYLMSFIKLPKWAIRLLESQMGHCLWNSDGKSHKFHLANWKLMSMKKEYGGLGVPNLRDLNTCLLGSWIGRYARDNDKLWKQLIDFKYRTQHPNIFTCLDNGVSNFWKGVLWAGKVAKMGYRWRVGNGQKIRFWEDI
jgi:hypothetical protein